MLRGDDEAPTLKNRALQALIDQRRAEPSVPLEDNVDEFLAAVNREA
ncbi:MAG: hypothetical protein ABSC06_10000 [Rhodopila sp.]